jgi:hypothetical protein
MDQSAFVFDWSGEHLAILDSDGRRGLGVHKMAEKEKITNDPALNISLHPTAACLFLQHKSPQHSGFRGARQWAILHHKNKT